MNKQFLKDSLGWGFILWLIGYVLGILLFAFVPQSLLGWIISPIGLVITFWVLFKKVRGQGLAYYAKLAAVWVLIAVVCDYLFIVKALKPEDGYYKADVYLYYTLTIISPLVAGWWKGRKSLPAEQPDAVNKQENAG